MCILNKKNIYITDSILELYNRIRVKLYENYMKAKSTQYLVPFSLYPAVNQVH